MKILRKIVAASAIMGIGAVIAFGFDLDGIPAQFLGGACGAGAVVCLMYL